MLVKNLLDYASAANIYIVNIREEIIEYFEDGDKMLDLIDEDTVMLSEVAIIYSKGRDLYIRVKGYDVYER